MRHTEDHRPRGPLVVCEASGKHRHPSVYWAQVAAREMHRTLNRNGELAVDTYGYRCPSCRGWHLTRRAEWAGEPQQLLQRAAPIELQQWAMTGPRGPQALAEGREDDDG